MRLLIAVLLLVYLLPSCRCGKKETHYFTTTTRAYFADFGEGSYWVYQNEGDPADTDTLTLVDKRSGMEFSYTERECDGDYFEYANYGLLSSRTGDTIRVTNSARVTLDVHVLDGFYHGLRLNSNILPNKDDRTFSVNDYAHDSLGIYPTYSLEGKTYADVMSMTFRQFSPSFPERAPTYVYARGIGLIAFSVYDEQARSRRSFLLVGHSVLK